MANTQTPFSIQDRTKEFSTVLQDLRRRQKQSARVGSSRQPLLSDYPQQEGNGHANGNAKKSTAATRGEFARRAAEIGRSISGTVGKLERLALLAKRKTLFDDRPVEISELTYIIKQDLSAINSQISDLQTFTKSASLSSSRATAASQESEHNKNVVVLLQGKLADVSVNFKDVLEVRTKNIQASRNRTENFVSTLSAQTAAQAGGGAGSTALQSDSPLYSGTPIKSRTPQPQQRPGWTDDDNALSLDPYAAGHSSSFSSSALTKAAPASSQQLMMMEEAQQPANAYISQRGEAIEAIERTISELGGIFGQLASMVSEQSEMIQRIDANTEDVVDNVEGAQRELLKYWGRISSNRWLIVKMFGVLMIFFLIWVLVAG